MSALLREWLEEPSKLKIKIISMWKKSALKPLEPGIV